VEARPYRTIRVEAAAGVATLTMSVPERKNALGAEMVNELLWALDDARDEPAVHVVVITGAGGVFSAGGDLKQMSGEGVALQPRGDFVDLLLRFRDLGKPTVARIEGVAMGGALGLVASADFAIAAGSAVLGTPEVRRGLFPMMIMAVLARVVPRRKLLPMMLLGDKLSAQDALEHGLLTSVVADADLDRTVRELAARLAAQSPTAIRMGLRAFHRQHDLPLEEALPMLRDELFALLGTEDGREGLAAFLEKREPRWTGR
jgi:enoyl-CoA hydratase/carnithine racemase